MIIVSGKIEVSPLYRMDLLAALEPYIAAGQKAFGNLRFHIGEDTAQSGSFYLYEEWEVAAARVQHMRTDAARVFRQMLTDMQVLAIELNQYQVSKAM